MRPLSPSEFVALRERAAAVFAEALALPALDSRWLGFPDSVRRHAAEPGFRSVGAFTGGRLIGFAEGYPPRAGQWWHDFVADRLPQSLRERWLGDAFELVELHLDPAHQGRGIGGLLHDRILEGVPQATAILSTRRAETPAMALYRRRGWVVVSEEMWFPGNPAPFRILGRDLLGPG